jgi:hypothetical protein
LPPELLPLLNVVDATAPIERLSAFFVLPLRPLSKPVCVDPGSYNAPNGKTEKKKKKGKLQFTTFLRHNKRWGDKEKKKKIFRYLVHVSQVPDESNKKRGKTKLQQQQQPRK